MELNILDKSDSWLTIIDKLREEHDEALTAINNLYEFIIREPNPPSANNILLYDAFTHDASSELLDIIQVAIGALDKLREDGLDIFSEVRIHNKKLKDRDWYTKGVLYMQLTMLNRRKID